VNPDNILGSFSDLTELAEKCPRGCSHLSDAPDCALNEALADGILGPNGAQRIDSLQRLLLTFKSL
jgi:ribosome biogenesis GTPase